MSGSPIPALGTGCCRTPLQLFDALDARSNLRADHAVGGAISTSSTGRLSKHQRFCLTRPAGGLLKSIGKDAGKKSKNIGGKASRETLRLDRDRIRAIVRNVHGGRMASKMLSRPSTCAAAENRSGPSISRRNPPRPRCRHLSSMTAAICPEIIANLANISKRKNPKPPMIGEHRGRARR